jgi:hypothetical protein
VSTDGFLVVERFPRNAHLSPNSGYRGIDRTPPWSQKAYESGFDDPYVFGGLTDSLGLLPTLEAATVAKTAFERIYRPDELEIIWVTDDIVRGAPERQFLGYDIAAKSSPFSSALADPPVEAAASQLLASVSEYGLFERALDAQKYMDVVSVLTGPYEGPLTIWKVFRQPDK